MFSTSKEHKKKKEKKSWNFLEEILSELKLNFDFNLHGNLDLGTVFEG